MPLLSGRGGSPPNRPMRDETSYHPVAGPFDEP